MSRPRRAMVALTVVAALLAGPAHLAAAQLDEEPLDDDVVPTEGEAPLAPEPTTPGGPVVPPSDDSGAGTDPTTAEGPPAGVSADPTEPIESADGPVPQIVGPRIVGGNTITLDQAPYQARLFRNHSFRCGGSVIDPVWIITAAHCVEGISAGQLLVGVDSTKVGSGGVYRPVETVVVHPGLSVGLLRNDIALLRLSDPVATPPIGLVGPDEASLWEPGDDLFVTGWGAVVEGGSVVEDLRGVEVPRLSDAQCAVLEDGSEPPWPAFDAITQLCAGELTGGEDSCQGDSGGPLATTDGAEPVLVGIVSWGHGCARPGHPGIYTRVVEYADWIRAVMALCGAETSGTCDLVPTAGFAVSTASVNGSYVPLRGDFNGDGFDDLFWYGPGSVHDALWLGSAGQAFTSTPVSVSGTYTPVVGDFDGDGFDDVFWYGPGGSYDTIWLGGAAGFSSRSTNVNGYYDPFSGDFDGDGFDDVFWYGPGGSYDTIWLGGAAGFSSRSTNVNGSYRPAAGDFDSDGRTDVLWYGVGAAYDAMWISTGPGFRGGPALELGGSYTPLTGDFDGSGSDDVFWYRAGGATEVVWWAQ